MPKIISLEEVEDSRWVAKYRGNYGTYSIRLVVASDGRAADFSCTCPSDYHPCKHIAMIMDAISGARTKQETAAKAGKGDALSPAKLLAKVPEKELRAFVIAQAAKIPALRKAVVLEFAPKANAALNPYARIIRDELSKIEFDEDNEDWYDNEMGVSLDILDEMLDRASAMIKKEQFDEAVLVAKACLEEYAEWVDDNKNAVDYIGGYYAKEPFDILHEAAEKGGCDVVSLYAYCNAKSSDAKFDVAEMRDNFYDLMLALAIRTRNRDFLAVQDKLLADTPKTELGKAERILSRKMAFHCGIGERGDAGVILHANLHIDNFRMKAVDDLIAARNYGEAKTLIHRYPPAQKWRSTAWDERLLAIAKAERDTPKIREYAWRFIENRFDGKYYKIYKSAFTASEWEAERERILAHYAPKKNRYYGYSDGNNVADVLVEEKLSERLLTLMEKQQSPEALQQYHTHFAALFPDRTLALFRKLVDKHAAANTGNRYYDDVAKWLMTIREIPGGAAVCAAMLADYRETYKRRPAMMRILTAKFGT